MATSRTRWLPTACLPLGLIALGLFGCGKGDGLSDYDRMVQGQKGSADSLASSGAKMKEKQYVLGKAWVVDLSGVQVSDDILKQVKQLGNVAELNLSKSTITDSHLKVMHDLGLHVLLNRLDLSKTSVTDAALDQLDGCMFLATLNLSGTKVTPAAAERFKQKRLQDPKAKVKVTTVQL